MSLKNWNFVLNTVFDSPTGGRNSGRDTTVTQAIVTL